VIYLGSLLFFRQENQICFGNDKFFGLSFLHNYSRNLSFRVRRKTYYIWKSHREITIDFIPKTPEPPLPVSGTLPPHIAQKVE